MTDNNLRTVLQQRPLGLVFDIDGTLSPIVPTPDEAQLYPGVAHSLEQARAQAQIAILTGRAVVDGARIVNIEGLTYIGTHGLEWCDGLPATHPVQLISAAQPYVEPGKRLLDLVEQHQAELPGVIVQRKSVGGSIHYRLAADEEQTRQRILALLQEPARQAHMRLRGGKKVIELLPPLDINKGQALHTFVQRFALQGVVFAGDDLTDLDAVLEVERLRQSGLQAYAIAVRYADTIPALLEHANDIVEGVAGMAARLQEIVKGIATSL